jgi:heat shock protein HslJ
MNQIRSLAAAALLGAMFLSSCASSGGISLDGTAWELQRIVDMPLLEGTSISIAFEGGEMRGNAGCNHYFGSYTLNSVGGLQFGVIAQTEMACLEGGVMEQESTYLQHLSTIAKAVRQGTQLTLQDAAGDDILTYSLVSE